MNSAQSIQYQSVKSLWAMLIYFVLCFYYFGVIMMTHFVNYPALSKIHEHIQPVMDIFNNRMTAGCYIPSILLVIAAAGLYLFSPEKFPRWAILASIVLTIISMITTFFLLHQYMLIFQLPAYRKPYNRNYYH